MLFRIRRKSEALEKDSLEPMAGTFRPSYRRRSGSHLSNASSSSNLASIASSVDLVPKKFHPPNKKQHEADLKDNNEKIAAVEHQIETLQQSFDAEETLTAPRRTLLSEEIKAASEKVKIASEKLKCRHDEVEKKQTEINHVRIKTTYRSESQIDQTIERLEYEHRIKHFSLREEEKIINEINKLRRSKQELRKFNNLIAEKDALAITLIGLRAERQACYAVQQKLAAEERGFREKHARFTAAVEEFSGEIYFLNKHRQRLIKEHETCIAEWETHLANQRRQKRLEAEQAFRGVRAVEVPQDFLIRDRYASEKQLVGSLLTYLQHHLMKEETTHSFSLDSPHDTLVPPPVRSSTPPPTPVAFDETPGYFLPKKYHDVAVISRCVGKTKKDKKKNKPIAHSAAVVAQFTSLDLFPPATTADVPVVIDQLIAKKQFYDQKSQSPFPSVTATPKTSPFEEVAPPFPPIDVDDISPSEAEARSKARASRIPSITLSNEEHVSVILLNNFSTLNIHRAASFDDGTDDVPVQVSSSESTVIQSNDSVEEPDYKLEPTSDAVHEPLDISEHPGQSGSVNDDQRTDSGIGHFESHDTAVNLSVTEEHQSADTVDGASPTRTFSELIVPSIVEDSSLAAIRPGSTCEDSLCPVEQVTLTVVQKDRTATDLPGSLPVSPGTKMKHENQPLSPRLRFAQGPGDDIVDRNSLRPCEIIPLNMCPETPPIDEALFKRPSFGGSDILD